MDKNIVNFDVNIANDDLWNSFFDYEDEINLEIAPEDTLSPRNIRKRLFLASSSNPNVNVYRFLMFLDESVCAVVGYCRVTIEKKITFISRK